MEHSAELGSLMIVVAAAFLVPIFLHRLRLRFIPVVVAEIVVGLIIGKSGFNLVSEDPWLELLSMLGFIFLMFLSGLEVDFNMFRQRQARGAGQSGPHPLKISLVLFLGIFVLSFLLALVLMQLGLVSEPYLMTIIISTISLGVVVPVLKEKKLMETVLGQTILLTTIVSDLITMVLLAVYISLKSDNPAGMLLLLVFFITVLLTYFFLRRVMPRKVSELLRAGTVQIGTRAVFALILAFVVLSVTLQVEIILGAFLAGIIVSLLAPNREFIHQLDTFGYGFLIPIFFVMIGVNIDLFSLFSDPRLLIFIPLLLAAIFISKLIPVLLLGKWYEWKQVLGSGVLLSSTLSLVIAAAAIAFEAGIINQSMQSALILVAVLSCIISPIWFSKVFPEVQRKQKVVAIAGANHITLPVSQDLKKEGFDVHVYSAQPPVDESKDEKNGRFPLIEVPSLSVEHLTERGMFEADIVVFGTMDDEVNLRLGRHAKEIGVPQIIVRLEHPERHESLQDEGITLISTLYASRTLLKALIEHPSAVQLITQSDDSIREITVNNGVYHNVHLRDLPFLRDALILRIYRGESFIIPHGASEIKLGDRLLVSGDAEHLLEMKRLLE